MKAPLCRSNGKRHNDFSTYLFKSTNYGKTWTNMPPRYLAASPMW